MQEYLNTETYEYKLAHSKPDGEWVCIPEGAERYNQYREGDVNNTFFLRMIGDNYYFANKDNDYSWDWYAGNLTGHEFTLWQRPTQPETLPFIDDNPQSLNEQYAEIEQVRQQTIEATLTERGSRYGDFESVAGTTRALMRVLGNGDTFEELSAAQYEALHMICSKMARIVNGDPDYKDNWHDIGGYAKLIENNA